MYLHLLTSIFFTFVKKMVIIFKYLFIMEKCIYVLIKMWVNVDYHYVCLLMVDDL